jgi:quercetin dioxygenase-like cupin family protein
METGTAFTALDYDTGERFQRLRQQLGVSTFGMNLIVLQPGQRGRIHRHTRQGEVYLVLEGTLTLYVEGEEHALAEGEIARVAPDVRRQLVNRGPARVGLIALGGAQPHEGRDGEAFESWDATEARPPQETPLPDDLPAGERNG